MKDLKLIFDFMSVGYIFGVLLITIAAAICGVIDIFKKTIKH